MAAVRLKIEGKREGFGTFEGANGTRYIGQFKEGCMDGYGIYRWEDGSVY